MHKSYNVLKKSLQVQHKVHWQLDFSKRSQFQNKKYNNLYFKQFTNRKKKATNNRHFKTPHHCNMHFPKQSQQVQNKVNQQLVASNNRSTIKT